jgi:circadian clock protein KaiB
MKKIENRENGKGEHLQEYVLYITGASPNSSRAVANIGELLEKCLGKQYTLRVVDVYQQPQIAKTVDIIALPLLVRTRPSPERRVIGDLSDRVLVMRRFELKPIDQ